jgi:hypothetical protein
MHESMRQCGKVQDMNLLQDKEKESFFDGCCSALRVDDPSLPSAG